MTSYAGLELLIRYLRRIGFNAQLRQHLSPSSRRRLWGRGLVSGDPGAVGGGRTAPASSGVCEGRSPVAAFLWTQGYAHGPQCESLAQAFWRPGREALRRLNAEVAARVVGFYLHARTLTIDVDGTVLCTGHKVGGAARGYNPHHRKVPSYYPVSAFLAESGHVLRLHNRPGNVNDGKSSVPFLRALFDQIQETLGPTYHLRFRMDGDYFKEDVLDVLESHGADFAMKVPFWRCLDLQSQIRRRQRWQRVEDGVDGFFTSITVKKWERTIDVAIYRKRVFHETRKNYQLDLFDPARSQGPQLGPETRGEDVESTRRCVAVSPRS